MRSLEPVPRPIVGIDDLLALPAAKVAKQHQASRGSLAPTIFRRPPVTGSLQIAQIVTIHGQNVVEVGKVGCLDDARAVAVVDDAVIFQCVYGARVRAITGMVRSRTGGVDAGDARVRSGEGAEDSFGHGRSANVSQADEQYRHWRSRLAGVIIVTVGHDVGSSARARTI